MLPSVLENKLKVNQQSKAELQTITAEAQSAIFLAKQFPRDIFESEERILKNCQRIGVAESAIYSLPRGKDKNGKEINVTGASIRLAELIVRELGNIQYGIRELDQGEDWTKVEVFAWDLETNFKATRTFTVKHYRYYKDNSSKKLTSSTEIYETIYSIAARRLRGCLLEVIPSDILECALNQCEETRKIISDKDKFNEKLNKLVNSFINYDVSKLMLEKYLGHNIEAITLDELDNLRGIFAAIRDGNNKVEDYFEKEETNTTKLNNKLKEELKEKGNK